MTTFAMFFCCRNEERCKKSRRCSKSNKHGRKCDTKRPVNSFWLASPSQEINTFKRGLLEETDAVQKQYQAKAARMGDLEEKEQLLSLKQNEVEELKQEAGKKNICGLSSKL